MQIAEGIHRLGSKYVNLYAVEDGDRITIVDGGLPGYWGQIAPFLEGLGRSMTDVVAIVHTHAHTDHVGISERLRAASNATAFVHETEVPVIRGEQKVQTPTGATGALGRPRGVAMVVHMLSNGGSKLAPVSTVEGYAEGDVLDVPGKPRIVFTPGHSPGHSCLLLEQLGILFTGDALVTRDLRGRTGPRLMDINADHVGARDALDQLQGVQADLVLPGHGEPWRGGVADAVERARRS